MTRCDLAILETAVHATGYATEEDFDAVVEELERAWAQIAELEKDQGLRVVIRGDKMIEGET